MKNLNEVWFALTDMFRKGEVSTDHYLKGLLCIAREWVEIGNKQEARDLVAQVNEKYLNDVMPGQMQEDPEFHQVVCALARGLAGPHGDAEELEVDLAILRGPAGKA